MWHGRLAKTDRRGEVWHGRRAETDRRGETGREETNMTVIDMQRTGRQLKAKCDKRGVTVRQIQEKLHIGSFQSVYSWFQGKTLPNLDNFYALAKLLGVPMESMIVEKKEPMAGDYRMAGHSYDVMLEISRMEDKKRCYGMYYAERLMRTA